MKTKIGRNDLCPCGSGTKYKKCCLMVAEDDNPVKSWIDDDPVRYWIEDDGIHIEGHFAPISSEDLKILTKEYQEIIRDSSLWVEIVQEHGEERAEDILKQFQIKFK